MSRDACAGHADGFVGLGHWKLLHELNSRREVGIIVRHSKVLSGLVDTFEADWSAKETIESAAAAGRAARAQEEPQGEHEEALAARSSGEGGIPGGRIQDRRERDADETGNER